ncbi:MAG TPA: dTMP kinase [Bryobacteraceae bacterium]|nr:dTMP kinase [Bryobacteraceae bacterium]
MPAGLFITFEGLDGCGKTTQIRLLAQALRDRGRAVVETAEPGGTDIGRQIRRILLDPANKAIHSRTELLLYFGSRAQNVEEVIRPTLSRGQDVICDRFTDSTLVYQGCGRGLDTQMILDLDRIACNGLVPDLTLLIDIDLDTSLQRARRRNERCDAAESRIDEESFAFHDRVRRGYLGLAEQHPGRFRLIDGRASVEEVADSIWKAVAPHV